MGVEIDGGYHLDAKQKAYDLKRQKIIEMSGWTIYRFEYPDSKELLPKLIILTNKLYEKRMNILNNNFRPIEALKMQSLN